jgi:hypothetical protein
MLHARLRARALSSAALGLLPPQAAASLAAPRAPAAPAPAPAPPALPALQPLYRGVLPWAVHSSRGGKLAATVRAGAAAVQAARVDVALDKAASLANGVLTPLPARGGGAGGSGGGSGSGGAGGAAGGAARRVVVGETALRRIEAAFSSFSTPTRLGVHAIVAAKLAAVQAGAASNGTAVARLAALVRAANESGIRLRLLPDEVARLKADGRATANVAPKMPFARVKPRDPAVRAPPLDAAAARLREHVDAHRADIVDRARAIVFAKPAAGGKARAGGAARGGAADAGERGGEAEAARAEV